MPQIEWNERFGAAANARRELPRLAEHFFSQVTAALSADPDAEQLHRVRLAAKRMRYTLELFRPCYGAALEQRIECLRKLQQVLGEINDCAVTRRLLAAAARSPHRAKAERFLAARQRARTAELRRLWTTRLGVESQHRRWLTYLARNAHNPTQGRL
ncbi:MAG TPA: CHAD domain-containing protein [Bryobacteraceae bacterium]|nr:CHAD domain-containing protein [Bryobacteraceae bacterium]